MIENIEAVVKQVQEDFKKKPRKFDASIDISINLEVSLSRGCVFLPHGAGKKNKVAVIAKSVPDFVKVDRVDDDKLIEEIKAGKIEYDRYFIELDNLKKIASLARILGPKGVMPSVKNGSVISNSDDWKKVEDFKMSRIVDIKSDKQKVVNMGVGRVSDDSMNIVKNIQSVIEYIKSTLDGNKKIFKSAYLTSTMGNSFLLSI